MEKRALVTGGCGFIGSNLTKELVSQGWTVDIVDDMSNGHIDLLKDLNGKDKDKEKDPEQYKS